MRYRAQVTFLMPLLIAACLFVESAVAQQLTLRIADPPDKAVIVYPPDKEITIAARATLQAAASGNVVWEVALDGKPLVKQTVVLRGTNTVTFTRAVGALPVGTHHVTVNAAVYLMNGQKLATGAASSEFAIRRQPLCKSGDSECAAKVKWTGNWQVAFATPARTGGARPRLAFGRDAGDGQISNVADDEALLRAQVNTTDEIGHVSDGIASVTASRTLHLGGSQPWTLGLRGFLQGTLVTSSTMANPKPRAEVHATVQLQSSSGAIVRELTLDDLRRNGVSTTLFGSKVLKTAVDVELPPGDYKVVATLRSQAYVPGRQGLSHKRAVADFFTKRLANGMDAGFDLVMTAAQ